MFLAQLTNASQRHEVKRYSSGNVEIILDQQRIELRKDALLPKVAHFYNEKNEETALLKSFGIIKKNDFEFPKKIVYFNKSANAEMTIDYSDIKINKKLAESVFTVKIPPNVRQVNYE